MAVKVSIACMDNFSSPLRVVHRIPLYDEDGRLPPHFLPKHAVESTSDVFYFVSIQLEVDIPYNEGIGHILTIAFFRGCTIG